MKTGCSLHFIVEAVRCRIHYRVPPPVHYHCPANIYCVYQLGLDWILCLYTRALRIVLVTVAHSKSGWPTQRSPRRSCSYCCFQDYYFRALFDKRRLFSSNNIQFSERCGILHRHGTKAAYSTLAKLSLADTCLRGVDSPST